MLRKTNQGLDLPQKVSSRLLKLISTSSGAFLSVLSADLVYFVRQQINQKNDSFKLSKKTSYPELSLPLAASVIVDSNKHGYAIYPYDIAGTGQDQSKVKFAQDVDTFKWYAVKKFTYKPTSEIDMLKKINRFESYLEIAPKSNRCSFFTSYLYRLGLCAGRHYVVQELVDGDTLLKKSYWIMCSDLSVKIKTAFDILLGVEDIHSQNIIHRDIKGSNIMFDTKKQQWVLVDFGNAMDSHLLPANGKMIGNPVGTDGFDSPETSPKFHGKYGYTLPSFKSDIYSLGVAFKKYIFYDLKELESSSAGRTIASILSAMTDSLPAGRPCIDELINGFKSQLGQVLDDSNVELRQKHSLSR